jgi:hypothetical protein
MAITGAHVLLYTPEAAKVRAILRDVFALEHVDAGDGWLIFRLPPAEVGVHPSMVEGETSHDLSFMCDDINATIAELAAKGIEFTGEPSDQGFGIVAPMRLPGGLEITLYQPHHKTAI